MYVEEAEAEAAIARGEQIGPESDSEGTSSDSTSEDDGGEEHFGNVRANLRSAAKQGEREFWNDYFEDGGSAFGESSVGRMGTAGS